MDIFDIKPKKVLVVDDFANVRRSIKGQLMDLGITNVFEAHDADSAHRIVKETKFDLILCDYNLGKGRDGARLLEEWRSQSVLHQASIFVLITAETSREIVVSAMEFSPDDYLAKPFTMEVLANRLIRWFERRQVMLPIFVSLEKRDWPALAELSKHVIEEHPRYRAAAQKYFVEALIQQKQYTQAEHFLRGLVDKRFVSWAQASLHRIDFLQNKFETAELGLKEVLIKDPNLIEAYDLLATSLQALDKDDELQIWLEHGVARAPKNIERQRKLVEVAQKNLDFHRASQGLRDIVNMSSNTMHEHVGIFQEYIKNLQIEDQHTVSEQRKREISKEIASVSRRMNERYSSDPNSKLFSKALVVQKAKDPSSVANQKLLDELFAQTFELTEFINSDTGLFLCETFYRCDRENDGDELISKFKEKFKDNREVVRRLEELQAEPVSFESRKKAKQLNYQGIELYRQKQYAAAIPSFRNAMLLSPRHPGIILNLVQSTLLKMKAEGISKPEVDLCIECLDRLKYLPEDHSQFERFNKLKENLSKIQ